MESKVESQFIDCYYNPGAALDVIKDKNIVVVDFTDWNVDNYLKMEEKETSKI